MRQEGLLEVRRDDDVALQEAANLAAVASTGEDEPYVGPFDGAHESSNCSSGINIGIDPSNTFDGLYIHRNWPDVAMYTQINPLTDNVHVQLWVVMSTVTTQEDNSWFETASGIVALMDIKVQRGPVLPC